MAVRRPQFWHDECIVVGIIQLLHVASLQTLLTMMGQSHLSLRFNSQFPGEPGLAGIYWSKGWRRCGDSTITIDTWCVCTPFWVSISFSNTFTFSSVYGHFGMQLLCLWSLLRVSRSLLSNVSSDLFVQFYLVILLVVCINVHRETKLKVFNQYIHYSDRFLNTKVSHGNAVTQMRCGGILNHRLIASLLPSL